MNWKRDAVELGRGCFGTAYLVKEKGRKFVRKITIDRSEVAACLLILNKEIKSPHLARIHRVERIPADEHSPEKFLIEREYFRETLQQYRHRRGVREMGRQWTHTMGKLNKMGIFDVWDTNIGVCGRRRVKCFDFQMRMDDANEIIKKYLGI